MTNALVSFLTADTAIELATWVPSTLLASLTLGLIGLIGKIALNKLKAMELEALEMKKEIARLVPALSDMALRKDLGNMGDRFDERFARLREDFGGLRERIAVIESRDK